MTRAVLVQASGTGWHGAIHRLSDEGVLTPVLWVGDPDDTSAVSARWPGAEHVSAAALRGGRISASGYAGAYADFWTSDAHHRLRRILPRAMASADTSGTRRAVAGRLVGEALIAWTLAAFDRTRPEVAIFARPPTNPAALVLQAVARHAGLRIVTAEDLEPFPAMRLVGPAGPVGGDGTVGIELPPDRPTRRRTVRKGGRISPLAWLAAPVSRRIGARYAIDLDPPGRTRNVFIEDAVPAGSGPGRAALLRAARIGDAVSGGMRSLPGDRVDVALPRGFAPDVDLFAEVAMLRAVAPEGTAIVIRDHPDGLTPAGTGWMHRAPALYRTLSAWDGVILAAQDAEGPPPVAVLAFTPEDAVRPLLSGIPVVLSRPGWLEGCPGLTAGFDPETPASTDAAKEWISALLSATALATPLSEGAIVAALSAALGRQHDLAEG